MSSAKILFLDSCTYFGELAHSDLIDFFEEPSERQGRLLFLILLSITDHLKKSDIPKYPGAGMRKEQLSRRGKKQER